MFKVRLFTSIYVEENATRRRELRECLARNADCPFIDEICLLQEQQAECRFKHAKLRLHPIPRRPLYEDFFKAMNQLCQCENDFSIIANSDIYFDRTLSAVVDNLKHRQCAALSRWDIQPDGHAVLFDRNDSQDAWIFRGPVRSVVGDFCVGIPRCDNRILYELRRAGYEVINPAFSIRALHLHSGPRADYPNEISGRFAPPPYEYLFPSNLVSLPQFLYGRMLGQFSGVTWRVNPRFLRRLSPFLRLRNMLQRVSKLRSTNPDRVSQ